VNVNVNVDVNLNGNVDVDGFHPWNASSGKIGSNVVCCRAANNNKKKCENVKMWKREKATQAAGEIAH